MPKCCYDCKNLDSDYEWDEDGDETIFFQCTKRGKSREFVEDLSVNKCDKYNPYKDKRRIPNELDRRFCFEVEK